MSEPPQSQARRTLGRQVAWVWGVLQLLWLPLFALLALSLWNRTSGTGWLGFTLGVALLTLLVFLWSLRLGLRSVDRLVGPTLDRLAHIAEATEPRDVQTGERLPSLVSQSPNVALGQLAVRLEEAQAGLRARIDQLSLVNQELAQTREGLVRAERLAVTGRLSAGLAHEVGNPLGALIGFVSLARDAAAPGRGQGPTLDEALAGIEVQAQRIHRTLQELMDFARAGKMDLVSVDLAAAAMAAARLVKAHPRWRHMSLALDVPETLPRALSSEHHLVQVLVNLLLNAADACKGEGEVRVAAATAGERLELVVADGGPGVPAADSERIFEPFFSSKPVGEGTGLGLAICRQLMESFGGSIQLLPSAGGARFQLVLRQAVLT